jgi:hypothetical protein
VDGGGAVLRGAVRAGRAGEARGTGQLLAVPPCDHEGKRQCTYHYCLIWNGNMEQYISTSTKVTILTATQGDLLMSESLKIASLTVPCS